MNARYPKNADILFDLGLICNDQRDYATAETLLKQCLNYNPLHLQALTQLGLCLVALRKSEEAIKTLENALAIERSPETLIAAANVYRIQGDKQNAEKILNEVLEIDPKYLPALTIICEMRKMTVDDAVFKSLKKLSESTKKQPQNDQIALNFALGKAYFDMKDYAQGMVYYQRGNRQKQRGAPLPKGALEKTKAEFETIIQKFSKENLESLRSKTSDSPQSNMPIFVTGMPRSGTTLVEQIIASHADVTSAGELNDLAKSLATAGAETPEFKDTVQAAMRPENLAKTGETYLKHVGTRFPDTKHVTDKMPFNYMWLGLISLALPKAKMIICMRNPMDCGLSIYRQNFLSPTPWYNDLDAIGQVYNQFIMLVRHWQDVMPNKIHIVDYDKLVVDPKTEARKLTDFLGFEWSDDFLEFYKSKLNVTTASIGQVRQKINTGSLELWRNVEDELAPLYDQVSHHLTTEKGL